MSLVGIFRAADGITALVDSKGSIELNTGKLEEHVNRIPEKLHPFAGGVLVNCGAIQIHVENEATLFARTIPIEQIIRIYLAKHHTIDAAFFQELLTKMNTSPLNKEPAYFVMGRKIWDGKYQIEYHKVGYDYYAMKIGSPKETCFVYGTDEYVRDFRGMDYSKVRGSVDTLQKHVAGKLSELIAHYDQEMSYNPVGGPVKSYVIR